MSCIHIFNWILFPVSLFPLLAKPAKYNLKSLTIFIPLLQHYQPFGERTKQNSIVHEYIQLGKRKKTLTYRLSNLLLKMPKLRWKQNNKLCTLYVFQHAVINRGLIHNSNPPEKTAKVKIQEKIQDLWRNASEPLLEIREEKECEMPSEICKA